MLRIVSGHSEAGSISISSTRFTAKAVWNESKQTPEVIVYPNGQPPRNAIGLNIFQRSWRFLVKYKQYILFSLVSNLSIMLWSYLSKRYTFLANTRIGQAEVLVASFIGYLMFFKSNIATWHGAEHMVIAAYERNGGCNREEIMRESPVHPKCGGRIALPLLLLVWLSIHINSLLLFLCSAVFMLYIDSMVGLERLPIFSHASRWVQSFTTKQPGEKELKTAIAALEALIKKHRLEDNNRFSNLMRNLRATAS